MDPRRILYTRQQIGELTGIDDQTLNYWSREGVLRSASGGGGKGQHRRFDAKEVHLAAILGQLRRYGGNIEALRAIAGFFHEEVIDWLDERGFGDADMGVIMHIQQSMAKYREHGSCTVNPAGLPADLRFEADYDGDGLLILNWEQTETYLRAVNAHRGITDRHFEEAKLVDEGDLSMRRYAYMLLTHVQEPDAPHSGPINAPDLTLFVRDEKGDWFLTGHPQVALEKAPAFIAIDVRHLIWKVWNQ